MVVAATELDSAVFVVDDDSSIREAIKNLLKSVGLHAETFGSAEEFLSQAKPEVPSCLVLDVKLPGVNGLEFQAQLNRIGIEIPIVFITAHGDIPSNVRALKAGAVEFLAKPFQKEELLGAVRQAIEMDRVRRGEKNELTTLHSRIKALDTREREASFESALLKKMASNLSMAAEFHQALNGVVEFVANIVSCDSCLLYVLEGEELVLRASTNPRPDALGRLRVRIGQGITGWVAEHQQPVMVPSKAYDDPRFKALTDLPEDRYESFFSVPLVSGRRLVGVINLQNRAPHEYTRRETNLMATIGFLVGAEVERARLESENSRLADQLETRKVMERAKGILQRDLEINEEDAYLMLQRECRQRRKPMREVAEAIILSDELKNSRRPENS
jgi:FixJ family two-component response regulator